jgi:hypothetical protein
MPQLDISLLTAALVGYQHQLDEINTKIAQIKKSLGSRAATPSGGGGDVPTPFAKASRRGRMSAAGRKRIAAAQRKRWKEYHKKLQAP